MATISLVNQNLVSQSEVLKDQGSLGERRVEDVTGQVAELAAGLDREISSIGKQKWAYAALAIIGFIGIIMAVFAIEVCPALGILGMVGCSVLSAFSRVDVESCGYQQTCLDRLKGRLPEICAFAQEHGIALNRQNLQITADTIADLANAQRNLEIALDAIKHAGEREFQDAERARSRLREIQQDVEDLKNHGTIYRIEKPSC